MKASIDKTKHKSNYYGGGKSLEGGTFHDW